MSIYWTIDYRRIPVVVRGHCTLLICQREAHADLLPVVRNQLAWWNRQVQSVHLYRHHYQLRFDIRGRLATAADGGPAKEERARSAPGSRLVDVNLACAMRSGVASALTKRVPR